METRNKIKSYIVREGFTMAELVGKVAEQYGWYISVLNFSGKHKGYWETSALSKQFSNWSFGLLHVLAPPLRGGVSTDPGRIEQLVIQRKMGQPNQNPNVPPMYPQGNWECLLAISFCQLWCLYSNNRKGIFALLLLWQNNSFSFVFHNKIVKMVAHADREEIIFSVRCKSTPRTDAYNILIII